MPSDKEPEKVFQMPSQDPADPVTVRRQGDRILISTEGITISLSIPAASTLINGLIFCGAEYKPSRVI